MDDYNVNVLSEAKNEYSSRLVSTLTPLLIQGIKAIFNEAVNLCRDNEENEKYLMTFQNFLSRVPKWNENIVTEETKRIVEASNCPYLEDLLTCVHITQLKILTSIRVSQKQKKIDLDIPKLNVFVHKCYISFARKLYSNVYLFEKDIAALQHQKNMRECELICHECILGVIRDSMPVETILRAYIDETVDEEVIEETLEKNVEEAVAKQMEETSTQELLDKANKKEETEMAVTKTDKPELVKNSDQSNEETNTQTVSSEDTKSADTTDTTDTTDTKEHNIKLTIATEKDESIEKFKPVTDTSSLDKEGEELDTAPKEETTPGKLTFNDMDSVLDMGTNKSSEINAPKTVERLEKISAEQNQKRKEEEAEYDDDDEERITIFDDAKLNLDNLDVHDLNKKLELDTAPILDDVEVLA
mgnify:CR=1 FL=1|tara:strand:- start:33 stop:1280 length:1248 start_codon:yes stop_codon:yes gene_type:complete